jgi:hypothetical protein
VRSSWCGTITVYVRVSSRVTGLHTVRVPVFSTVFGTITVYVRVSSRVTGLHTVRVPVRSSVTGTITVHSRCTSSHTGLQTVTLRSSCCCWYSMHVTTRFSVTISGTSTVRWTVCTQGVAQAVTQQEPHGAGLQALRHAPQSPAVAALAMQAAANADKTH